MAERSSVFTHIRKEFKFEKSNLRVKLKCAKMKSKNVREYISKLYAGSCPTSASPLVLVSHLSLSHLNATLIYYSISFCLLNLDCDLNESLKITAKTFCCSLLLHFYTFEYRNLLSVTLFLCFSPISMSFYAIVVVFVSWYIHPLSS